MSLCGVCACGCVKSLGAHATSAEQCPHVLQPEVVEHVLEPYRLYGPEFSFLQDLDSFLSEYDEGFVIPLQHGVRPIRPPCIALSPEVLVQKSLGRCGTVWHAMKAVCIVAEPVSKDRTSRSPGVC